MGPLGGGMGPWAPQLNLAPLAYSMFGLISYSHMPSMCYLVADAHAADPCIDPQGGFSCTEGSQTGTGGI